MVAGALNPGDITHATTSRPARVVGGVNQRRWFSNALQTEVKDQDLNDIVAQIRYAIDYYSITDVEGDDSLLQKAINAGALGLTGNILKLQNLVAAADKIPYFSGTTSMAMFTASLFSRNLMASSNSAQWRNALGISAALSDNVVAFGSLVSAADLLPYFTGAFTMAMTEFGAFGRALISAANAAAARTVLEIGVAGLLAIADGGTGAANAADARTNLGLVIGTNVQASNANLTAYANLVGVADRLAYFTGAGASALATFTTFGRSLAGAADAPAGRAALALGTLATQSGTFSGSSSGTNTGDQSSIVGISGTKAQFDLALSDGNFLFVGDIGAAYTDADARAAIGAMVDGSLIYVGGTPLLSRAALTGDVTASQGSNALTIAAGAVTSAKFRNSAGFSVVGRSATAVGVVADIVASLADQVLRMNAAGTAIGFGAINVANDNAVTGVMAGSHGGTGSSLVEFTGPTTTLKTFTLPNASDTIATLAAVQALTNKTITGGVIQSVLNLNLRNAGVGAFDVRILPNETLTAARSLSVILGDIDRILTFSANATIGGINTGDQTITLTGDVTGSGVGSFITAIAAGVIVNADISAGAAIVSSKIATGVSGAVIPLLSTSNIWSLGQIFNAGPSVEGGASSIFSYIGADSGTIRGLGIRTGVLNRWVMAANGVAEAGANVGSNLVIFSYDDAGAIIETPLSITRATGNTVLKSLSVTGAVSASNLSGTNTGDQNTIAAITGTKAQFNTAVSDGDLLFVGDAVPASTITGILTSAFGGTGNGFTKFTGPVTAEKTFTLPDRSDVILTRTLVAGSATAGTAPFYFSGGTLLTVPNAGAMEFDGATLFATMDATHGRGQVPVEQKFKLDANVAAISTIANLFGANSNIPLIANAWYEIDIYLWFIKTTAGTITYTLTNSAAPTSQNLHIKMSPLTGILAPAAAANTYLEADVIHDVTAAFSWTTGSISGGSSQYMHIKIKLRNSTGTSLLLQGATSAGSFAPQRNSHWIARRVPSANAGAFVA